MALPIPPAEARNAPSDAPDDRLQQCAEAWNGDTLLNPEIYRWANLRYTRSGVRQIVPDERVLEIPETFVYPLNPDRYLLYSPLAGVAAEVNHDVLAALESLRRQYPNPLMATMIPEQYKRILNFAKYETRLLQPKGMITCTPRMYRERVDLCLTSACNMRCEYCFAGGGERPRFMSWEIAKSALDQTVAAVLRQGKREVEVAFQGDGEQFLAWPMMVRCTDYIHALAQSHGLRLRIWAITNGYLTSEMVCWALAHLDSLAISLDGPPDMHDAQRPLPNGQVSSSRIVEVIRQIDSAGGNYSLRATVAQHSVARMREIVEYVVTHFPRAKSLVLDPLFPSYVSSQSSLAAPTADEFVNGYLEAQQLADAAGLELGYTGLFTLHELTGYHCDAWGIKLAVTPDGFVTSCPIIATREDPRAEFCIYGRYEDGNFHFNWTKLRKIMARNLNNLPFCSRCIARWHCAGECYSRLMMVADQSEPWRSFRCDINRRLIIHELERSLTRAHRSPAH